MKIVSVEARTEELGLTRPYTIAFRAIDSVSNIVVEIRTDSGRVGLGAASPEPRVTGETPEICSASLAQENLGWLVGRDTDDLAILCYEAKLWIPDAPAARAAIDMALHDLFAQDLRRPLADVLGRVHSELPTSITIGIQGLEETLVEAHRSLGLGFSILKVKTGLDLEGDLERLRRLRESIGRDVRIRVDANQGYTREETIRFFEERASLDLEFVEQPMQAGAVDAMRELPEAWKERIAADESLLDDKDALALAAPPRACGIFNIKLMKCGGIRPALRIAAIAQAAGIDLMWGCMDESRISIAAALHAAFASPATRHLDLDGSLDLARDVAEGGFVIERGRMRLTDAPGLGVTALRP
ncbi:MAG TPA: dipeptide epimerase [Thermoanaerobaculia bacterium]|nr:dipeptide epimerase [Thermoanaerobaculia bacterium]